MGGDLDAASAPMVLAAGRRRGGPGHVERLHHPALLIPLADEGGHRAAVLQQLRKGGGRWAERPPHEWHGRSVRPPLPLLAFTAHGRDPWCPSTGTVHSARRNETKKEAKFYFPSCQTHCTTVSLQFNVDMLHGATGILQAAVRRVPKPSKVVDLPKQIHHWHPVPQPQ